MLRPSVHVYGNAPQHPADSIVHFKLQRPFLVRIQFQLDLTQGNSPVTVGASSRQQPMAKPQPHPAEPSVRLHQEVWLGAESNRRHEDFQSSALPTELPSRIALPLSRCIERPVLIKAENPQRRVAAAIYRRSQSAATETSRLDRAPPYHCRASIPACCFFAAGGSACPIKFPRVERIQLGRCSAEPGKDLRLDGVSPYQRSFTGSFASN